jgi:hypothetical protein
MERVALYNDSFQNWKTKDITSYEQFLHIDYALIDCCDCIYMLKDWKDSNGARLELNYAKCKGKEILYETE